MYLLRFYNRCVVLASLPLSLAQSQSQSLSKLERQCGEAKRHANKRQCFFANSSKNNNNSNHFYLFLFLLPHKIIARYICMYICICVCVHIYKYMYMYICICVCASASSRTLLPNRAMRHHISIQMMYKTRRIFLGLPD